MSTWDFFYIKIHAESFRGSELEPPEPAFFAGAGASKLPRAGETPWAGATKLPGPGATSGAGATKIIAGSETLLLILNFVWILNQKHKKNIFN